jgi:CrcB protein
MLKTIALVFVGGGFGSTLRYMNSLFMGKFFPNTAAIGTFTTNIIGCLLIGILLGLSLKGELGSPEMKFFFITGFCGGFTTFSAFSAESLQMVQQGQFLHAALYVTASLLIGIFATWLGLYLTRPT